MRRSVLSPLALAFFVVLGVAACGSDSGGSAASTSDSSSSESSSSDVSEESSAVEASAASETASETAEESEAMEESSEPVEAELAAATEVTIEHYSGSDIVPINPEVVVVMDTAILLSMDALGVQADGFGSLGVPVPEQYSAVLEHADLVMVGTAFEPDYEAINALEPDLIIVASRSSATYPEMSKIAPTVDLTMSSDVDYVTAFTERHLALGQIFGVEAEVQAQLGGLSAEIQALTPDIAAAGTALVLLTNGDEISAFGPGSRYGYIHDVFGYAPADASLDPTAGHGDSVSFEFIAEAAPDTILVLDRSAAIGQDGESAAQVLDNELVNQTPAALNNRIVYVDGFSWYIAGDSIPAIVAIIEDLKSSLGS